jgi:hypothetical protein
VVGRLALSMGLPSITVGQVEVLKTNYAFLERPARLLARRLWKLDFGARDRS